MTDNENSDLKRNLRKVIDQITIAAQSADRDPNAVSLVAVSKTKPAAMIEEALAAGQKIYGENRVQEAASKFPGLREAHPDLRLHLIGPLQTNKVRQAVGLFDVIETLDRPKLARALAREMAQAESFPDCLIQINTGEEEQKAGIPPAEADAFIALARDELGLPVKGLMCIPPVDEPPAPHFMLLRTIAERNSLPTLSMGMSGDFEVAIELGATHVRVGSAIFGARKKPQPE